jgi:hypothetical protein
MKELHGTFLKATLQASFQLNAAALATKRRPRE